MAKRQRHLAAAAALAAFYTICGPLTAFAVENGSVSAALKSQILTAPKVDIYETMELLFDYLSVLKEEGKTPKERIEALLAMYEPDPVNKGLFKHGPIMAQHWFEVLKDFHVDDVDSMNLLYRALSTFKESTPQFISSKDAESLLNLGQEVSKVETPSREARKIKALTLRHLALLEQKDKEFGRPLGVLALEQMAETGETPDVERRDAIFRVLYSYFANKPNSPDDGDLLFRDVIAAAKIVRQSKNKYDIQHLDTIYNELRLRCNNEQALAAQKDVVDAALLAKVDERSLHVMLLELSCAYLNAGRLEEAEDVLSKIQKSVPLAGLLLSQCLLKQQKYVAAEKVAQQVANAQFPVDVKYPSFYIATADAICAASLIGQKKYEAALPLLLNADRWFSRALAQENAEIHEFAFAVSLLPSDNSVLSDLALTYDKLGQKEKAQKTKLTWSKLKLEKERIALAVEKDALINAALQDSGETRTAIKNAKRLVEISPALEKQPDKRAELILSYAESLIKNGNLESAQFCLDALAGNESSPAGTANLTNLSPHIRTRLLADRIMLAEERADLASANALMKELLSTPTASPSNDLRMSEVDARLSLLSGDFEQAEAKSRALEAAVDATSKSLPLQVQPSQQDNFVSEHQEAILDRVQALNRLRKYSQAARLARLLLLVTNNKLFNRTGSDSAANLAFAYANDGHKGMGETFEQEAAYKNTSSLPLAPSRYMVDAKEILAALSEARSNPIRARRYRAEAQEMRRQLQNAGSLTRSRGVL